MRRMDPLGGRGSPRRGRLVAAQAASRVFSAIGLLPHPVLDVVADDEVWLRVRETVSIPGYISRFTPS